MWSDRATSRAWSPAYLECSRNRMSLDEWVAIGAQTHFAGSQLCDLFARMKAVDEGCSRVNGQAAGGERRRLRGVELTARGLENFSISDPSIMETVRLPNWTRSDHMAWPPPQIPLAVRVAAAM